MTERPVHLRTTLRDFEHLHDLADGRGSSVRCPKHLLLNLLTDHSTMVARLGDCDLVVTDRDGAGTLPVRVRKKR